MNIYTLDPISDSRWSDLAARHPRGSAFHTSGWLRALRATYGYMPFVLTNAAPDRPLDSGLLLCRVSSRITGTRLVSLPFADHCEPLLAEPAIFETFLHPLIAQYARERMDYVEFRPRFPLENVPPGFGTGSRYWFHELDLTESSDQIFSQFHKSSIQRKVRRAEREGLSYEDGSSSHHLEEFYRLLILTRRRHCLPPQPREWFQNLLACMGDAVQIRLACKDGHPIAAILTLRYRSCVIYKNGCSDEQHHNLGGMPFLFWRLIVESKSRGMKTIDFGRSDLDNEGLVTLKDRLGATKTQLIYYRYPANCAVSARPPWAKQVLRRAFSVMPDSLLTLVGSKLYRHMG